MDAMLCQPPEPVAISILIHIDRAQFGHPRARIGQCQAGSDAQLPGTNVNRMQRQRTAQFADEGERRVR